jgi:hypothetical protein
MLWRRINGVGIDSDPVGRLPQWSLPRNGDPGDISARAKTLADRLM